MSRGVLGALRPQDPTLAQAPSAKVTKVQVFGPQATVVYRAGGQPHSFSMIRENGVWKATTLGIGTPTGG